MSMINITSSDGNIIKVEAKFSFETSYDFEAKVLEISGAISCSDEYIYDVVKIESDRYIIDGVRIYSEAYGSETDEIMYSFTAKSYEIK